MEVISYLQQRGKLRKLWNMLALRFTLGMKREKRGEERSGKKKKSNLTNFPPSSFARAWCDDKYLCEIS